MKEYVKPTIEFIELKPEERLACESGKKTFFGTQLREKFSFRLLL